MEWFTQNWIWIALAAGIFFLMKRRGMGCCGSGQSHTHHNEQPRQENSEPPTTTRDPVSGDAVDLAIALTSVYKTRIYYFTSRENRDRFEAEPDRYAS